MAAEKKTFLQRLKTKSKNIKHLFTKKDKEKLQNVNKDKEKDVNEDLEQKKNNRIEHETVVNDVETEEDELKNFTYKIVYTDSVSSQDSGYLDNYKEEEEECIDKIIQKKVIPKETSDENEVKNIKDNKMLENISNSHSNDDKKLEQNKTKNFITKHERNDDTKGAKSEDYVIKEFENLNLHGNQKQKRSEHVLILKEVGDKKDVSKDTDDVTKRLGSLSLNSEGGKKKNVHLVVLARPPERKSRPQPRTHPFRPDAIEQTKGTSNMINQVNPNIFSGGNLIVNSLNTLDKIRDNPAQYNQNCLHPVDNFSLCVRGNDEILAKNWNLGLPSPTEYTNHDVEVPRGDFDVELTLKEPYKNYYGSNIVNVPNNSTQTQNKNETDDSWNLLMDIIKNDTINDTPNIKDTKYPQAIETHQNTNEEYQNSPQYLKCLYTLFEDTTEIDDFLKDLIVAPQYEANTTQETQTFEETQAFGLENDNSELRDLESSINLYPTPPRAEHSPIPNESVYYPLPNEASPNDYQDSNQTQIQSSPEQFYEERQQIQLNPSKEYENSLIDQSRAPDSVQYLITESPMSNWSYTGDNTPISFRDTSPSLASPNSIYDNFQEIQPIDKSPSATSLDTENDHKSNKKGCLHTLKQYKEMQKKIADFSNEECCKNRMSCKEFFQERFNRLETKEQKRLLVKVASLDWKIAYGVLHHILRTLSLEIACSEDGVYALFAIICELILGKWPHTYNTQYGLELLNKAALDCPHRPILTRYLVRCVRLALQKQPDETRTCVFTEAEFGRNSLVWECVKKGDKYAPVLAELLIKEDADVPLFNVQNDDEGYSPLHVACLSHSAATTRLHTVHALLTHGATDLWKGDVKGNDTAVHLAVNSPTCDLSLVLLLFSSVHCGHWTKLANLKNRCKFSPRDYAIRASKPGSRQHYPVEVLEFLQKRPKQTNE